MQDSRGALRALGKLSDEPIKSTKSALAGIVDGLLTGHGGRDAWRMCTDEVRGLKLLHLSQLLLENAEEDVLPLAVAMCKDLEKDGKILSRTLARRLNALSDSEKLSAYVALREEGESVHGLANGLFAEMVKESQMIAGDSGMRLLAGGVTSGLLLDTDLAMILAQMRMVTTDQSSYLRWLQTALPSSPVYRQKSKKHSALGHLRPHRS